PEISLGLARILAERLEDATKQVGIEYVNLFKGKFDPRIVGLLPQSLCLLNKLVPIAYVNNAVTLAMVNPSNLVAFDDVRRYIKGVVIEPQVCTEDDFKRFMDTVYPDLMGVKEADRKKEEDRARNEKKRPFRAFQMQSLEDLQNEILSGLEVQQAEEEKPDATDLATASEDAPIVRLANNILALAIKKGASDIHIEPHEDGLSCGFELTVCCTLRTSFPKRSSCRWLHASRSSPDWILPSAGCLRMDASRSELKTGASIFECQRSLRNSAKRSSCVFWIRALT
ncbi:MAG: hypothetical protein DMG19_09955, partial [Acidobacteria bacterium]